MRRRLTDALDQLGALHPPPPPEPQPERTPESQKRREEFERMDHAEQLAMRVRCMAIRIGKDSEALSLEWARLHALDSDPQRDEFELECCEQQMITGMQVVLRSTLAYVRFARSIPLDEPTTQILLENCRKALAVTGSRYASDELTLAGVERTVSGILAASQDSIDECKRLAERRCSHLERRFARAADPEERSRIAGHLALAKAQRLYVSALRGAEIVPRDRRPAACCAVRTHRHRRVPRSHRHRAASIGKLAAGDPDPEPEPPNARRALAFGGAP